MITRDIRSKIIERFKNKDDKIFISNIIDKIYRFEKVNKLEYTDFLNLNEEKIVVSILNELNIKYYVFKPNENCIRKVIFFIPDFYDITDEFYSKYVKCLKIIPNVKGKLLHKDYMGTIYSLGLKESFIGDIFSFDDCCYAFCINNACEYIEDNLFKVARQEVKIEQIPLYLDEVKNLNVNLVKKEYIVPSLRIDAILSTVYVLSRNETKEKILNEDLYINDKNIFYPNTQVKKGDIISFRRCGKILIGEVLRNTKSGNIVIEISKYS